MVYRVMPAPAFWTVTSAILAVALVVVLVRFYSSRDAPAAPPSRDIVYYAPAPTPPAEPQAPRRKSPLTDPYAHAADASWVTLAIDSRDRDPDRFPRPDAYEIQLAQPLRHVMRARLLSAEVPSTFYVFTQALQNTSLHVKVGEDVRKVTIPDGNYGIDDMIRAVQYYLNETFPNMQFEVVADPITHCLGIHTTSHPPTEFAIVSGDTVPGTVHWGLAYYLGFQRHAEIASHEGRLEGARPVVLNPETYMMLDVEEFGTLYENGIQGGTQSASARPFAKIPIQVHTFQYSYFDMPMGVNEMNPPVVRLDKLRIRWRFHDGTPIDFQDVDHSFTLELLCAADRTSIT